MADIGNLAQTFNENFKTGFATGGGRLSGIGAGLAKIVEQMKAQETLNQQVNLLGKTEEIKQQIKQKYPEEYKPKTKEEALALKRAEAGIKDVPSEFDIQKEARTTVNAMIDQNTALQIQAYKNPSLLTDLIDKETERLSAKYRGGEQDNYKSIMKTESPTVTQKSPYPEYPDAFQENGTWKVMRGGEKYRIE